MENITIRKASLADVDTIVHLGRETFIEAFAKDNTEADLNKYLQKYHNAEKITSEINTTNSTFFIAQDGDLPVGFMKLNTGDAQTEPLGDEHIEIERIYVKASHYGKKIGQLMMDKAILVAHQKDKKIIWLGVWEKNQRAIRFYEKNGFSAFGTHPFMVGDDLQTDVLMRRTL